MSSQRGTMPRGSWIDEDRDFEEALRMQELEDERLARQASLRANEKIGDEMSNARNEARTRMVFHNTNGYNIKGGQGGQFREACQSVYEMGAEFFGVQEHNLDTNQATVAGILRQVTRTTWDKSKLEFGTSPQRAMHHYKPGGTLSVVSGRLVGRIISSESDYLGRWTRTLMAGQQGRVLVVYNTYVVGKRNPEDLGEQTVARQLQSVYAREGRERFDPRTNHLTDLCRQLRDDRREGYSIILGGDFNTSLDADDACESLLRDGDLVDAIGSYHDTTGQASYHRGSKIIDYILVSADIRHAILRCGYHAFDEYLGGDHRAMFLDFDTHLLFGTVPRDFDEKRLLCSVCPDDVVRYIREKHRRLTRTGYFKLIQEFRRTPTPQLAERIDALMVRASLGAEKQCKQKRAVPFSPIIKRLRLTHTIHRLHVKGLESHYPRCNQIRK